MASHTTLVEGLTAAPSDAASRRQDPAAHSPQPQEAPVARSNSEQTAADSARPSTAMSKLGGGLVHRLRDSMRRHLRTFGTILLQTHVSAGAHAGDSHISFVMP
ncbi:hypothetical protein H4R21_003795 [Coemansia helicoidea]|uniref:Uncharacterized protein n=1 Tax=Coemansia helicoidea TaxID=1286919 RepID=A0ACC1L149_9FUNG|nr:hypothetical protein H4R21_003795 [Coemansia helicoidea]